MDIPLDQSVVLIGPNNSGKTTALQALALWDIGLRRWNEKRKGQSSPEKRPGVTVNRKDLISIPIPSANLLWSNLRVRNTIRENDTRRTENVRLDIIVDGALDGRRWTCGLEFDYANEESFYCRPLRLDDAGEERMSVPEAASESLFAYLPPMSGLADREYLKQSGEIGFLIGQGQTAQVLRNLCHNIYQKDDLSNWERLKDQIHSMFGVELLPPNYISERSEISMSYKDQDDNTLDLSCAGRGLQQTILLLAHLVCVKQKEI